MLEDSLRLAHMKYQVMARKLEVKKTVNSNKFRQKALFFEKYGVYTSAIKGTSEFKKFWDKEIDRCLVGFTAEDGDYIPGYFYFYLNYCQIRLVKEIEVKNKHGVMVKDHIKKKDFPYFYDYDRAFFEAVEECERVGKHLVVLKSRRKGYSFKCASMLCRNFYLIPDSKSYALASETEFLIRDGILTKAWDFMDFIDEHTAWTKKRQKADTKLHKRASFVTEKDGTLIEMGYKSDIMGVSLKNDSNKARGKAGKLILFEEAGKFPNLQTAWQISRPSVEQGTQVHGLQIAFGTGGSEEADYQGMKELFYEPDVYNCLAFENEWDEGASEPGGFFVPCYVNHEGETEDGIPFMDENGNSNMDLARSYFYKEREKIEKKTANKSAIDRHMAEHPMNPMEATLQISTNIFPKKDLIKHLAYIRNNRSIVDYKQIGELVYDENSILVWQQNDKIKDLTNYRIKSGDSTEGAIVIWEHPAENPPYGLYIAGCDPYDHDKSGTNSLGSLIIYKRFQTFESYYEIPVAEYTARPETADEFYENVKRLLEYYNANLLYENEKKGLFAYFANKHCEYLLADQPDLISDIIKSSNVQRRKGIHMVQAIKDHGERLIRDWLSEEYSEGKKNLTKLMSEALLEELIFYDEKGNFDRVMAFMLVMLYRQELHNLKVKEKKEINRSKMIFEGFLDFNKDVSNIKINI